MGAFDWTNKVVLVTGGTRGIGLETALCFARAGARPVITYRWGGSEEAALGRFSAEGLPPPRLLRADVSRESDTQRLMTELKADCDGIDAFVSNVSVASMVKGLDDYKLRALQRSIECTS